VKARVTRSHRSPLNKEQWNVELDCGHSGWVTSKRNPTGTKRECTRPHGELGPLARSEGKAKRVRVNSYQERIEEIIDATRDRLTALASEYRSRVMVPLCRKHKLTYIAGMGRTVFYNRKGVSVGSMEEAPAYLVSVFDVLDSSAIGANDCFGFYVADITEHDWLKP
jgi:hypothetical protein